VGCEGREWGVAGDYEIFGLRCASQNGRKTTRILLAVGLFNTSEIDSIEVKFRRFCHSRIGCSVKQEMCIDANYNDTREVSLAEIPKGPTFRTSGTHGVNLSP
jgi:hypothetical protein